MKTEINGRTFYIEEFNDGWGWISENDESQNAFETPAQATQNAMDWVRAREAEAREEQEPDSYRAEVTQLFDRRDYQ